MRIASVAFTIYDADPRVRRMSEALVKRGDEVVAIALRQPEQPRQRSVDGVQVHGVDIKQHQGTSLRIYVTQYLRFLLVATWLLTRFHLKKRFDVVHVNNMPDFLVFAALPAKLLGAKVILDLHDPMPELFSAKFDSGATHPVVRAITVVERLSIAFADRAITVQQVHLDTFVSHGNPRGKFVEVQNAADTRIFPVGAALSEHRRTTTIRIVYHGTIAPRLGLDTLVYAVGTARDALGDVEVTLIGDGEDADRIQTIIRAQSLDDIIHFEPGFVPVSELLPFLERADIGVVPAGLDPFTARMLPSKLLEYVTLGIPTACADLPAVRHYFRDDELAFFPPGDIEALAGALVELSGDPEARELQAKRAMRFLDEHSWPSERQKYLDLVDELGRSRRSRTMS